MLCLTHTVLHTVLHTVPYTVHHVVRYTRMCIAQATLRRAWAVFGGGELVRTTKVAH